MEIVVQGVHIPEKVTQEVFMCPEAALLVLCALYVLSLQSVCQQLSETTGCVVILVTWAGTAVEHKHL